MEKAIRKAIEGGYKNRSYDLELILKDERVDPLLEKELVLDPAFWIAIGKTEKWGTFQIREGRIGEVSLLNWHRMVDALWKGNTIEEFFADLLK